MALGDPPTDEEPQAVAPNSVLQGRVTAAVALEDRFCFARI